MTIQSMGLGAAWIARGAACACVLDGREMCKEGTANVPIGLIDVHATIAALAIAHSGDVSVKVDQAERHAARVS